MSGDKIAKKIVDLSKRNRELGAEVIRHKQTIRDLQSKIRECEVGTAMCDVSLLHVVFSAYYMSLSLFATCHYHCLLHVIISAYYMSLSLFATCHYQYLLHVIIIVYYLSLSMLITCHYHCFLHVIISIDTRTVSSFNI